MRTVNRIYPYGNASRERGFGQFSHTQKHTPRPRWPHVREITHGVRLIGQLLFGAAMAGVVVVPGQAQTVPLAMGDGNWTLSGSPGPTEEASSEEDRHAEGYASAAASLEPPAGVAAEARVAAPKITITATRDTIFGGLEDMRFVLKREAPGEALTVRVKLSQDEKWLTRSTQSRSVYFYPNDTNAVLKVHRSQFDPGVTRSGSIIAKVVEASGYDIGKVKASVLVISSPDPLVTLFVARKVFTVGEDAGQPSGARVFAIMAPGMPRGVSLTASLDTRGKGSQPELTATSGEDYEPPRKALVIHESSFAPARGNWVGSAEFVLPILDDDLREGDEVFEVILEADSELSGLVRYRESVLGKKCASGCVHRVHITDDDPIPEMDLSVSADEIMEEGETSSIARVSITNGGRFADEQMLTFGLGGTATMGADYAVSPSDADTGMPGYQVILPAQSASVGLTFKAMSDEVQDPDEKIEVSASLDGDAVGDMQAIRIMNQQVVLPKIAVAANRTTIIGSMEDLVLTLTREAPLDEALTVTVQLTQEQRWLSLTSCPVTFAAGEATATVTLRHSGFSTSVVESGDLTASVHAVDGYDTDDATATVYVVSQDGPAVRVFFDQDSYRFGEDREDATAVLIAEAAPGMPRGTTVAFSMSSESGTAKANEDFKAVSQQMTIREEDFSFQNGSWQVRRRLPVTLIDDEIREGDETCDLVLESAGDAQADLALAAVTPVDITDDEDIPVLEFSVKPGEIRERDESSSTATVAITNGKTFAADQTVTFAFDGTADEGADYLVAPADADNQAPDHQATLAAQSTSVGVTLTARDDGNPDPNETVEISATHDGDAIGNGVIRIVDLPLGPEVAVTFEGVDPPRDHLTAGIATGPFTSRFTFSEPVEGFVQDDVVWQTHAGTTLYGTPIGVLLWDFTEVRAGLEYTVEVMPTQAGRLYIVVHPASAISVATGDGNQQGVGNLEVKLPENRMMVAPAALAVDEGDGAGAQFLIVLTSAPSGTATVTVSGMEGTDVQLERPTATFSGTSWTAGWAVTVKAGIDADAADEIVTLTVSASGGGYDGKTAEVVVTVRDTGASGASASDGEDDLLALVDGVTPETAAAALFGETGLSEPQLDALDLLGNRNGGYDLGDMLSWTARCRRGGARSGGAVAAADAGSTIPSPARPSPRRAGQGRRRRTGERGSGRRAGTDPRGRAQHVPLSSRMFSGAPGRRPAARSATGWLRAMMLAAVTVAWGCGLGDDGVQPHYPADPSEQLEPGLLTVRLTALPGARDAGAMLVVEGPGIDSLQAPGFELIQLDGSSSTRREVIVAGALATGPLLQIRVPHLGHRAHYRVELLQVAGEDYTLRDLSEYSALIRALTSGRRRLSGVTVRQRAAAATTLILAHADDVEEPPRLALGTLLAMKAGKGRLESRNGQGVRP